MPAEKNVKSPSGHSKPLVPSSRASISPDDELQFMHDTRRIVLDFMRLVPSTPNCEHLATTSRTPGQSGPHLGTSSRSRRSAESPTSVSLQSPGTTDYDPHAIFGAHYTPEFSSQKSCDDYDMVDNIDNLHFDEVSDSVNRTATWAKSHAPEERKTSKLHFGGSLERIDEDKLGYDSVRDTDSIWNSTERQYLAHSASRNDDQDSSDEEASVASSSSMAISSVSHSEKNSHSSGSSGLVRFIDINDCSIDCVDGLTGSWSRDESLKKMVLPLKKDLAREYEHLENDEASRRSSSNSSERDHSVCSRLSQTTGAACMTPITEAAMTLAQMGDQVNAEYGDRIQSALEDVLSQPRQKITYEVFRHVLENRGLIDSHILGWQQAVVLLDFSRRVAWSLKEKSETGLSELAEFTTRLITDTAASFIIGQGGWDAIANSDTDSDISRISPLQPEHSPSDNTQPMVDDPSSSAAQSSSTDSPDAATGYTPPEPTTVLNNQDSTEEPEKTSRQRSRRKSSQQPTNLPPSQTASFSSHAMAFGVVLLAVGITLTIHYLKG